MTALSLLCLTQIPLREQAWKDMSSLCHLNPESASERELYDPSDPPPGTSAALLETLCDPNADAALDAMGEEDLTKILTLTRIVYSEISLPVQVEMFCALPLSLIV